MLTLNDREWKEFYFNDIFEIKKGFYNKKPPCIDNGNIPFLGATEKNNGITQFNSIAEIKNNSKTGDEPNEEFERKYFVGNAVVVTNNGSVGHAYYQAHSFTCSHDVNPLYLKNEVLNKYIAKFIIACIEKQSVCFTYVHKWRPKRMVKSRLLLPVNEKGQPDYEFMEQYIREREEMLLQKYKEFVTRNMKLGGALQENVKVNSKEWKEFRVFDLFEYKRGIRQIAESRKKGNLAYYSASESNNGLTDFIDNPKFIINNSAIIYSTFGDAYYVSGRFSASDEITILQSKIVNKYIGLFISTMLKKNKSKYSFGRKAFCNKIRKDKIMLPIKEDGSPDYNFMENYGRCLMVKQYKKYLNFKKMS